jgi:hypothetical protein
VSTASGLTVNGGVDESGGGEYFDGFVTEFGGDGFQASSVMAFQEGDERGRVTGVPVLSESRHRRAVITCHMSVACELSADGATECGVVRLEVGVVSSPHELPLVSELDIG